MPELDNSQAHGPDAPMVSEASAAPAGDVAADGSDAAVVRTGPGLDLEAWKGDLQRLHGTIDQVVQSFISGQTRQLDAVAAELASQRERIVLKEQRFATLSDSIAGFVEEEAKRLEACGIELNDPEADARHEAYDAELPGPPALHRINRLWRKATRAFEAAREAEERRAGQALEVQRTELVSKVQEVEKTMEQLKEKHAQEIAALESRLEAISGEGAATASKADGLTQEKNKLSSQLDCARGELMAKAAELEEATTARARAAYEWDCERDELTRQGSDAKAKAEDLERSLAAAAERERELKKTCEDRSGKLEQMKRVMDDQERELNQKIDRVQTYVKERQASALHAEKKQQDAERLAERWQGEVRRLQAEKDKLASLVLDLESRQTGQSSELQGYMEKHQREVAQLREALCKKEEDMRAANLELLQQRDGEYQAKVNLEKQREKDRSIALLRKKEQEMHIKEQQLKAARSRIQELEATLGATSCCGGGSDSLASTSPGSTSRGSSSLGVATRPGSAGRHRGDSLPPLPKSAR
mmetsp:Transcript_78393/g.196863  ORF Transcript_78393/g.196863 Transcript_78393/m.196863 type:complete len:532 (+) Transcript_78393:54-1649(+)|eukprot:CAMPEP_0115626342 /NCGR_PEP_ID=MMETSP0272-20121206/28292_1 /TAXON_ID=71861 /ORGANISM="Scrippsiella trochoidea, Strain CCMP3099" /LENGTH=531 /DNA_ID=CAMNT_0003062689 /DNA_START=31 /DNA_END=1626 /DNA_ORIENTATION=-